jgi:hypothetical protein
LVVADENLVAEGTNFLNGFQNRCLSRFVVFAPPVVTPVVNEEVSDTPIGSEQNGAEVVLDFAIVVVAEEWSVVDTA